MKELAFICADNGVNKLLLDVRESNESAKAFYKKKGFGPGWRAEKLLYKSDRKCDSYESGTVVTVAIKERVPTRITSGRWL